MFYRMDSLVRTRHFDELQVLPPIERESMLFRYSVLEVPIYITEDDWIAGQFGYEEWPDDWTKYPPQFSFLQPPSPEEQAKRESLANEFGIKANFTYAHTCISYQTVLTHGLVYYAARVQNELAHTENGSDKHQLLTAMLHELDSAALYAQRYAALAQEKAAQETDPAVQARYLRMYRALCQVPMHPARNFFEAVQSIWLMHCLIPMSEKAWYSISLGRLDQYLYPYYRADLQNGIDRNEMRAILKNLFHLLDSYCDGACALNIGGMDADGNDQMNELSELLIEVEKELCLRAPIFAVRVSPKTPDRILMQLIDLPLFQVGQPTFYGELSCRRAMQRRGHTEADAVRFSVNSCMGLCMAGEEFADMWGCMFNMHLPLELAINHGKPLRGTLPFALQTPPCTVHSMDELAEQYRCYLNELLPIALKINRASAEFTARNSPNPLLSVLTEGCVESGLDRAIGARYNTVTVETMGLINTGNAMRAIQMLVFEQQKYTLEDFVKAAVCNYNGFADLQADLRRCEKYGTGHAAPNAWCAKLAHMAADCCEAAAFGNTRYLPALHTIDSNIRYGAKLHATLDGRSAGAPVNKNANPTTDVPALVPTDIITAAGTLPQDRFSGGQPIDVYFDKACFADREKKARIATLIRTYFDLGGLQFQVNSADLELLKKAHAHPEQYPQLIVRIGGYSAYFSSLGEATRAEFLNRFVRETGI